MKQINVLAFGEIIWDCFPDKKKLGGAPLNFASHLANRGVNTYLLSAVGADDLGKEAIDEIAKKKINIDFINVIDDKKTGKCLITLDDTKDAKYQIEDDVAYDYIKLCKDIDFEFDILSFGSLALRSANNIKILEKLISNKKIKKVYCDLNLREPYYNEEIVTYCLKNTNILKINQKEFQYIVSMYINVDGNIDVNFLPLISIIFPKIELIILTCDTNGSYAYTKNNGKISYCPTKKIDIASSVGAGDCFGSIFVLSYLLRDNIDECLKKATDEVLNLLKKE